MPRLGLTMVEGTVVEWRAKPGDDLQKGQILVVIESVSGTGPGGRISVEDVERAASSGPGLAMDVEGSGPVLLLVSGFGVDKTSWRRQIDGLRSSFAIVGYDHRGIGASRPMPDD